jgi:hypothetical protein
MTIIECTSIIHLSISFPLSFHPIQKPLSLHPNIFLADLTVYIILTEGYKNL